MEVKIIEAVTAGDDPLNWGKFGVGIYSVAEKSYRSVVDEGRRLLKAIGGNVNNELWVFDFQTGEAARFSPGGSAHADLHKHQIWVCPLFEPFLTWLYEQEFVSIYDLPARIELDAPPAFAGYRRPGPAKADRET